MKSQALKKVEGLRKLPIFPLPIVLLPNEILPLHIFEPKYRKMLKDIELTSNLFGVSYLSSEDALKSRKPPIGSVGCVTEIHEIQQLPDGRSNILTIGLIRYTIEEYVETNEPYLIAAVSYFEDEEEDMEKVTPLADEVFQTFVRIAKIAQEISGEREKLPEIPQAEPQTLSFLIGAAFNLPPEEKYALLETRSTYERLLKLSEKLKEIIRRIETTSETLKIAQLNGHAQRKIDI
ncbi:MAG: LON peptidase substrate-binding domain-containing protein [Pyrinomonadaceae bacterium]|nr:LON peptidase substrate-binding domain-containing protein [Pyrinomonadaceae bacterium]MCX7640107.1 LON peptidase substrate-binding domain-containing protein [Pyrinomonadaceae bacterium]MDW8303305.1 LON peptidase substrate-binding domain-containing protein [Acidobacteriota bacterium]